MTYRIGVYVRISREEAAQIVEGSIPSQKHRIQSFIDIRNAQQDGWGKIIEIYADEGISAKDMNRPSFQRMMRDLRKGKINMILVTELSRLSRSIMDFCHILEELKKYNAGFLSIKEQFDTSTPAGEMMVFNMINLAQFERKQTAERVSLNFHSRAMRGLLNGGFAPLGYDKDPQKKCTYIVNETEAAQVREIFQIYLSAGSLSKAIAAIVEANMSPKVRSEKDRVWTVDNLGALLKNRSYIGEREVNKKHKNPDAEVELKPWQRYQIAKASWPGIVDPAVFNEVQVRLEEALASERMRRDGMERRYFWLSGIVRCPECGKPFNGTSPHGRSKVYRYYTHQPIKGKPVTCRIRRIGAEEIEEIVERYLGKVLEQTGALDSISERIEKTGSAKRTDLETEKEGLLKRRQQLGTEIEKLISLKLVSQEQMVLELFEEKLKNMGLERKTLDARIQEIDCVLVDLQTETEVKQHLEERIQEFLRGWKKATGPQRKRLAQRTFSRLLPTAAGLEVYYLTDEPGLEPLDPKNKKAREAWDHTGDGSLINVVGRQAPEKGHFPSPSCYLIDTIKISEPPKYFDKCFLHQKYVVEGLSAKGIADLLGCSVTTIKARLREFGLTKGGSGNAMHREKLAYGKRIIGHRLTTHKGEIQVIETIKRMYAEEHLRPRSIASLLDTMKVPTKRQGKKWDHSVVIAILKREGVYKQSRKSPQKEGKV